jgi:NADH:ubiquinone oxidoreductase subunit 3 (subunit A)
MLESTIALGLAHAYFGPRWLARNRGIEGREAVLAQYLGLIATLSLAVGFAFALLGLARMLRRRLEPRARHGPARAESSLEAESAEPGAFACGPDPDLPPPQFVGADIRSVAILFLVYQAGALVFYLWGATFRDGGLGAAAHMAWFALPLVFGLYHAWARGAFD